MSTDQSRTDDLLRKIGCEESLSEPCKDGDHEACGGEFRCVGCDEDVPCEDECHDEEVDDDVR